MLGVSVVGIGETDVYSDVTMWLSIQWEKQDGCLKVRKVLGSGFRHGYSELTI